MSMLRIVLFIVFAFITTQYSFASYIEGRPGADDRRTVVPGQKWVQVYSRESLSEARTLADRLAETWPYVSLFRSRNSYFAVSIGLVKDSEGAILLRRWKSQGRIPSDSYLTDGRRYVEKVVFPRANPAPLSLSGGGQFVPRNVLRAGGELTLLLGPSPANVNPSVSLIVSSYSVGMLGVVSTPGGGQVGFRVGNSPVNQFDLFGIYSNDTTVQIQLQGDSTSRSVRIRYEEFSLGDLASSAISTIVTCAIFDCDSLPDPFTSRAINIMQSLFFHSGICSTATNVIVNEAFFQYQRETGVSGVQAVFMQNVLAAFAQKAVRVRCPHGH